MLSRPEPVLAPGAYDALSARLVEQTGFDAVYMTGFGTSASLLGRPDVGLLTFSEMVDNSRRLVQAVEGMDGALERARLYRDAGADALFVEAPRSKEEVAAVAEAFPDVPLLFNWLEGGETPPVPLERLKELGFSLIIFPLSTMLAATRSVRETLAKIHADGSPISVMEDRLLPFEEFTDFIGLPEIEDLEQRFEDQEVRGPR